MEAEDEGGVATARREGEELLPLLPATRTDPDPCRSTFATYRSPASRHKSRVTVTVTSRVHGHARPSRDSLGEQLSS